MKNIFAKITFCVVLAINITTIKANNISVLVTNVTDKKGAIYLVVCNKQQFTNNTDPSQCIAKQKQDLTGLTEYTINFSNISLGDWAIYGYIDTNNNAKLDTNAIGLPKETVVFATKLKGRPQFNDIKVSITKNNQTITLLAQ